jgi:ATP-dependent Clp protease adaptor protein ClpS
VPAHLFPYFRVATVRGIAVRVHWGVFAMVAGAVLFGSAIPGMAIGMGLFLSVVVIHELGHLFAALALGVKVLEVRLDWLGGSVRIAIPRESGRIFGIYSAGVLAQLLAMVGALAWLALRPDADPQVRWLVELMLVQYSACLIVLNLLPVHPSRGEPTDGAVLWALLAHWRGRGEHPFAAFEAAPSPVYAPDTRLLSIPRLRSPEFRVGIELLNDNGTPMNVVVAALEAHLGFDRPKAIALMLDVHYQGGALVPLPDRASAERVAAAITKDAASAGHALVCRAVEAGEGESVDVASSPVLATYRESIADGKRIFELLPDRLRIVATPSGGARTDTTILLRTLQAAPHRVRLSDVNFGVGCLIAYAWLIKALLGLTIMDEWGGFLATLGGIGVGLIALSLRGHAAAHFHARSGAMGVAIVATGPDSARFEDFVAQVRARIEATWASEPAAVAPASAMQPA